MDWGDFDRSTPFSPLWGGADRGRSIDRHYIRRFISSHAGDIRGRVLEVYDSNYTREFGGDRVLQSDVLDIDSTNPRATVVADLCKADVIAQHRYDCFILTQTLYRIYDVRAALAECARILKPGGVLLATLPSASRVDPEAGVDGDYWRFTAAGTRRLFAEFFPPERTSVRTHGNVLANIAFLYGLACHELTQQELDTDDPYFPLVVTVRAQT